MLSGERAILIKSFIEDRERLGTVSQKPIESVFDKNIYSSILSHKEQKSLEESIHLIQDNSGEIDLGEMMDNMNPPERNNDDDNNDTKGPQNSNIYEHEIKSILLTDMMSKKENEDQSTLKSITVSPESLESEQDKKKRNKKNK